LPFGRGAVCCPHGKILGLVLLIICVLAIAATVALQIERQPESSPVSRGARLAEEAGCFACHGRSEEEPRFNLRLAAPGDWRSKNNPSLWAGEITDLKVLVDWIANGVPADEAEKHRNLFIRMPAYKDRLTPGEIEDIAAWILAEGLKIWNDPSSVKLPPAGQALTPDQLFAAGDALSRRHGCYQCHGELGQGGVSNPDSFKGYIPGFQGQDFLKLTADGDRAEILHWIDHGRGRAIESGLLGRFAKKYFDGQAIPMPGYRDQLTVAEKELLADYLLLLNKTGPLSAGELERLTKLLTPSS
jgi:mono/diheme cytochrome c family protein